MYTNILLFIELFNRNLMMTTVETSGYVKFLFVMLKVKSFLNANNIIFVTFINTIF